MLFPGCTSHFVGCSDKALSCYKDAHKTQKCPLAPAGLAKSYRNAILTSREGVSVILVNAFNCRFQLWIADAFTRYTVQTAIICVCRYILQVNRYNIGTAASSCSTLVPYFRPAHTIPTDIFQVRSHLSPFPDSGFMPPHSPAPSVSCSPEGYHWNHNRTLWSGY